MPDNATVTLVDAMAYIFRAYYSQHPRSGPAGQPTNASFGFLDFLLRLIVRENPSHLAIVFDSGPRSFRNSLYADYKANRDAAPDDLLPQFAQCEQLAEALGLPVFKVENHEADDVLASLACRCSGAGHDVRIISGDKDLAQLVDERVSIHDPARSKRFTVRTVPKHFGVEPGQMVDYLALTGDASDNVPGVRGVGPKTASALLASGLRSGRTSCGPTGWTCHCPATNSGTSRDAVQPPTTQSTSRPRWTSPCRRCPSMANPALRATCTDASLPATAAQSMRWYPACASSSRTATRAAVATPRPRAHAATQ